MLRRNILIFHTGALGDFVLTWPLAAAMGRIFAQSRVIYVTHSQKGQLAERVLGVESADAESGWHHLLADPKQLPERPQKLLAGAQVIIVFEPASSDAMSSALARLCPQSLVVPIRTPPREQMTQHFSQLMLQQLEPWPVIRQGLEQMLRSVAEKGLGAQSASGDGVVIHPGSSRQTKCWPARNFIELATALRQQQQPVRFVLGEVELERWPKLVVEALRTTAEVREPATLLDLWKELHNSAMFIGNDSGPAHLSGIIGKPTLALFGPTDSAIWRPLGPWVKVLYEADLSRLSTDTVLEALSQF